MIQELLDTLRQTLPIEKQTGCMNAAVVGGTAEHLLPPLQRVRAAAAERQLSPEAQFLLQRLHDLWARYHTSNTPEREQIVDAAIALTTRLEPFANDMPKASWGQASAPANETQWGQASAPAVSEADNESQPSAPDSARNKVGLRPPAQRATVGTEADPHERITPPRAPRKPTAPIDLNSDVTYLKGIGPQRAKLLAKLGLRSVYDLLYYFPARYEDRRQIKPLRKVRVGEKEAMLVSVLYPPQTRVMGGRMGGRSVTRVRVGDATGRADLQWWNQPFREKQFQVGQQIFVYGKVGEFNGALQIDSPEFEIIGEDDTLQVGRIVPVYPMTEGLQQGPLRRAVMTALNGTIGALEEMLPAEIRESHGLCDMEWALRQIHFPDEFQHQETARARLVFEELFLLQVALAQKKLAAHSEDVGIRHAVEADVIKSFVRQLPYQLTGAQKRVMNEIRKDLQSQRPMNRLLHGDVGSGKTLVAAYALWTAHVNGHQAALMAPTEILAEQHFYTLTKLFKPLGIEVALLEGSLKNKQKQRIQADLNEGRVSIVVGTHALVQTEVNFSKLGICVIDEQHRFGVMQRAALREKGIAGARPDVLVMTATPIPRTMALTVYGDLDVSILDELPPGRQAIKTVHVKPNQRERAYKFVLDEVKKGRQAYVVCPLVEESEKLAHLKSATALAERLRQEELVNLRVGLVHGQMTAQEREEQMELFRAGMHDVLVATTVIEVGVDVANATVMLIEDAERFGLSQLHQLRGRVGRGAHKSYCVLMGDARTDDGRARLSVMVKTQNGFEIAEHDLQLRGPGEFYGTRQSGLPDFRLANIIQDVETIQKARTAAFDLVATDPHLQSAALQPLKHALRRFWGEKLSLIQVS